jgi:hypothetical protein
MGLINFAKSLYKTHVNNVAKASNAAFNESLRPAEDLGYGPRVNQHLYNPLSIVQLYTLAFHSDVLTTIQLALRRETFRNGVELSDAESTDAEIQTDKEGSEDQSIQNKFLEWMQCVNENQQTFIEVLEECEDDINTADDMFMLFMFDYTFDGQGKISKQVLQELLRMHPALMQFVINKQDRPGFTDSGLEVVACPDHRGQVSEVNPGMEHKCPVCDKVMYRVHFKHNGTNPLYYFKNEVFHMSRYRPSRSRGFSPISAIYVKQQTLKGQDEYVYELYNGKKPPKSMLIFNTSNQATLKKAWEEMLERTKVNRHLPAILGMEAGPNGKNVAQFFDFMRSLDELQFTEQRNEYRNVIGAVFGVMPIWQGDLSTGGGINNEGMEITIGNRTMEYNQARYNDKCFPFVLKSWGLENSVLKCRPSEEQDEKAKLERQKLSLENGEIAVRVGLTAKYDSNLGEVVIKDGALEKAAVPDPFGGFNNDKDPKEDPGDDDSGTPNKDTDEQSGRPEKPVEKSDSPPSKGEVDKASPQERKAFSDLKNIVDREIDEFVKIYKRKPTKLELEAKIAKINSQVAVNLIATSKPFIERTYKIIAEQQSSGLGVRFSFNSVDQNAVALLQNSAELNNSFVGLSNKVSEKINDVVRLAYETPKGLNLQDMKQKIAEVAEVADARAENIVRSEVNNISAAARRSSYKKADPGNTLLYKHIGPPYTGLKGRTTITSKNIMDRTKNGVPWDEYVLILTEESAKEFPTWTVNPDHPVSHWQSRHTFVGLRK